MGLQLRFVLGRCDAVDAGRPVFAGQPVGLQHPVRVEQVMQREQGRAGPLPRQISYPASFRGQVRGVQCPLPCFPSLGLTAWRSPSLRRVPAGPVPRPQRYYESATTSRPRVSCALMASRAGPALTPRIRCHRMARRQGRGATLSSRVACSAGRPSCRRSFARTRSGAHRFPGDPSRASALLQHPGRAAVPSPMTVAAGLSPGPTHRRPPA